MTGIIKESTMRYDKVKSLIDKNIADKLKRITLFDLVEDLIERVNKFKGIAMRDFGIDAEDVLKSSNIDEMESSRLRYNLYYIVHCRLRLFDLKWAIENESKFKKWNNEQIFKLIILKEKLHSSNSIPSDLSFINKENFKWDIGDQIKSKYSDNWDDIIAYAIVNDEPRYVIENKDGWVKLDDVRQTSPRLLKGKLSEIGNSFKLTDVDGRKKLVDTESNKDRLKVLLSSIRL